MRGLVVGLTRATGAALAMPVWAPARHNVVMFAAAGLRTGAITSADAPTRVELPGRGGRFAHSSSMFYTLTTGISRMRFIETDAVFGTLMRALPRLLTCAALVAAAPAPRAIQGQRLPSGEWLTPTAAPGAMFTGLNPDLPAQPGFTAGQASATALSPDGSTLLVLTSGYNRNYGADGKPVAALSNEYVFVFDVRGRVPVKRQVLQLANSFEGLAWAPDGRAFYVSGGVDDTVAEFNYPAGGASLGRHITLGHAAGVGLGVKPMVAGVAVSPDGKRLLAANYYNDSVSLINLVDGSVLMERDLRPGRNTPGRAGKAGGSYPRGVVWAGPGRAFVSSQRDREVIALDISADAVTVAGRTAVRGQPGRLLARGGRVYAALDNSDGIAVLDAASGRAVETIAALPADLLRVGPRLGGAGVNALALSADGATLYASEGGLNAVARIALGVRAGGRTPGPSRVTGLVPTGWYPTGVAVRADGRLYAINGKSVPGPNPQACRNTLVPSDDQGACQLAQQYVWQLEKAGLLTVPPLRPAALAAATAQVARNDGLGRAGRKDDAATMAFLRAHIRHVLYIIKENRTYDQVLGDLEVGDGDKRLALFPEATTPNQHAIARQFVTLDRFMDAGESSNTGWTWSTAARTTDFTEREAPVNYARRGLSYDQEGLNRNVNVSLATAAERHAANPDDLKAALRHDVQVLHPTAGLVGFVAGDEVGVHDLLAPPVRRPADWSRADAGPPPSPRLVSVEAEPLPTSVDDVLAMGQDDIGSDAVDFDEADAAPPPAESAPAKTGVFGFVKNLFGGNKPPAGEAKPPAGKAKPPSRESLQGKRDRQLQQLLALLQSDPDAGLQRALPLRDLATRGVAPPSSDLGRNTVEFNLNKLSGGGSRSDAWSMANDLRQKLTAEYREAANRELDLGRHRRAAYIFAHLLGDFAAAAAALTKGHHFREAAALHRDQLNNPRAAADCLAAGGLVAEAIPLYLDLSQFELAGDLHARLDQPTEAADCYRRAVKLYQSRGDPVGAARLLEGKLADADGALALLDATWPESDKAGTCLSEWFTMAARLGRHDAAAARAAALRDAELPWYRAVTLAETMATVATAYPNCPVRDRAADATRTVVGRRLSAADTADRAALVKAVVALVPGDKLLARDGARFITPLAKRPPVPTAKGSPPMVRTFKLPADHAWRSIVPLADGFLTLGTSSTRCTIVRGLWDGRTQSVHAARDVRADVGYALLPPDGKGRVVLAPTAGRARPPVGPLTLPAADGFPVGLTIATPPYVGPNAVGACRHETGITFVLHVKGGDVTVSGHSATDGPLFTRQLTGVNPAELMPAPTDIAARGEYVTVAAKRQLIRFEGPIRLAAIDLPAEPRWLSASPPHTAVRLLVGFEEGWGLVRDGDCQSFGKQLVRPVVTFTPDGSVVAVGGGTANGVAHEYRPSGTGLAFAHAFDVPAKSPVAVLPAGGGQVAIFDADGTVYVHRYAVR